MRSCRVAYRQVGAGTRGVRPESNRGIGGRIAVYMPVARQSMVVRCSGSEDEEPDWDAEMNVLRKRTLQSNQLEFQRQLEGKPDVGKVIYSKNGLAIVQGLNSDAPIGTCLVFGNGATGMILWRRTVQICAVMVVSGEVDKGEGVECCIEGILQVVDGDTGEISTRRKFEVLKVPTGSELEGKELDFRAHSFPDGEKLESSSTLPMMNEQVPMEDREPIFEPLTTGIKALDVLTPVGRGQALMVTGPVGSGQTDMALDIVQAQAGSGVQCVYAAVGCRESELQIIRSTLQCARAAEHATLVVAPETAPVVEQYAAICTALSLGEQVRDNGGHALVLVDDFAPVVRLWESVLAALSELGTVALEYETGNEEGDTIELDGSSKEQLVEFEGMLVSASAAQRRRFFASLVQRSSKLSKRWGGGSLTIIPILRGSPATGERVGFVGDEPRTYSTLSPEQQQKLLAALESRTAAAPAAVQEGDVETEVVEEFMSITDGQIVLKPARGEDALTMVDHRQSLSRIGSRAYPKALEALAAQVRLELAQADDATRFASQPSDPRVQARRRHTELLQAALTQKRRQPIPLPMQVVHMYAVQKGFLEQLEPSQVGSCLQELEAAVKEQCAPALEEISSTNQLTAQAEQSLRTALSSFFGRS